MSSKATWSIRVDPDLDEWFRENFPIHGAKQWFFESCLRKLRELHLEGKVEAPIDLINLTVPEVGKEM